jgi:hypothetical protein
LLNNSSSHCDFKKTSTGLTNKLQDAAPERKKEEAKASSNNFQWQLLLYQEKQTTCATPTDVSLLATSLTAPPHLQIHLHLFLDRFVR